ncbi:MAG: ABC transporter substrate-binding protein [Magnetococcales bacterium]|nr:ABC transporter substrate-binding protein [Magnetococcales bacterium]
MVFLSAQSPARAAHGISLDGKLKYAADFDHFAYSDPARARVGGTLTLHGIGGFDTMNPYTLKGTPPDMLSAFLFETLTVQSHDEPFAQYGLLARDIELAPDGQSITYTLNDAARFADGAPVTSADVAFSFETLTSEQAHPFYQSYWKDISRAEILDPRRIRFHFARKNRELPLITGELPVFSKAFFSKHSFKDLALTPPLGSGPYAIAEFDAGKTITYQRRSDYWGWNLPTRKGFFNVDKVVVKFYKDPVVALEAFKAGEFDVQLENNSKQWARDYTGPRFESGEIRTETLAHRNGAGMQGFAFNLRKSMFQDIRVRKAIGLAFDFEWSNTNLFYGQYTRTTSYFANSDMAASGKPSAKEMLLLEPFKDRLDPQVFEVPPSPPTTTPPGSVRNNLKEARELLTAAGWKMGPDNLLVDGQGNPFVIEMMLSSQAFERVVAPFAENLKRLGIRLEYRTVDPSLYQRNMDRFAFDMTVAVFPQSQSPGNEQRSMWHSESAAVEGSRNLIGIQHPAVDALVERIIYAESREELVQACRALDRVLLSGHYLVPNWHIPYHRIAYWNRFDRPATPPLYFSPMDWITTWWIRKE